MFDSLSEFMKERNQNMLNSFEAKLRESVQILIDLRLDRINKVGKLEPTDEDTQLRTLRIHKRINQRYVGQPQRGRGRHREKMTVLLR